MTEQASDPTDTADESPLPCPWCGETPEVVETINLTHNLIHRCDKAQVSIKIESARRASVLQRWNDRHEG